MDLVSPELIGMTTRKLEINGKYTQVGISEWMASTIKQEITIKGLDEAKDQYYFSAKGKRKQFYLNMKSDTLIFEGWDVLTVDSDTDRFSGNACINILGTVAAVKKIVEKNLNPYFTKFGCVLAVDEDTRKEEVVYLEKAKELGHGVVNRILDKMGEERTLSMSETEWR